LIWITFYNSNISNPNFQVFIPGRDKLEEGEELEFDNSAYDMLHTLTVEWPCLSFDILADKLGAQRTKVWAFIMLKRDIWKKKSFFFLVSHIS